MSRIYKGLSVAELGAIVSEALNSAGIQAVLCGGSVATIYSGHQWESKDLDFVVARVDKKRIAEVLTGLGFEKMPNGLFGHADHTHSVDTLPWPIVLGNEEVDDEWTTIRTDVGNLQILTPTQCVKDRLAGFYHSVDRQSLDRAVEVCLYEEVDMEEIRRWSEGEYATEKLKEFLEAVQRAKAKQQKKSSSSSSSV